MKPPTISTVSSTSQGRRSQGVFCLNVFYFSGPLDTNTLLTLLTPWKRSTEQVSFNTPATMTEIFFSSGTKPMHFVVSHFQFPDPLCFPMLYHDQGHHDDLAEFLETL